MSVSAKNFNAVELIQFAEEINPLESARENFNQAQELFANATAVSRAEYARLQNDMLEKKEVYRLALESAISNEKIDSVKGALENELNLLMNPNK
jgi:hypothetical protein